MKKYDHMDMDSRVKLLVSFLSNAFIKPLRDHPTIQKRKGCGTEVVETHSHVGRSGGHQEKEINLRCLKVQSGAYLINKLVL